MGNRGGVRRACLAAVAVVLAAIFAMPSPSKGAGAVNAYMPCGTAPHYNTFESLEYEEGDLKWRKKPRNCTYSADGTVAGTIRLADLSWRTWGGTRAIAKGAAVDNHDQDRNGFQHRPVKVLLRGLKPAFQRRSRNPNRYYTEMVLIRLETGDRFVIPLYWRNSPVSP